MKNETAQPTATEQAIAKIEFTDAKAFETIVAAINGLADKYHGLKIIDTASYRAVVSGIAEMRSLRIAVEERRKEKKAAILAAGRTLDNGAKQLTDLLLPIETELKATKRTEDARKAAIQFEKDQIEKKRVETIKSKIAAFPPDMALLPQLIKMPTLEIQELINELAAVEIDLEVYQEFTPTAIETKANNAKLLQEYYFARIQNDNEEKKRQAEAERVEQARIEQEAKEEAFRIEQERLEAERLAKIEAQRIIDEKAKKEQEAALRKQEDEQRAKQKIEDDRLGKIREQQEAKAQKLRDDQVKIDAQKKAIQDEKDQIDRDKAEQIRLEQEKQAQAEIERIAKIEAEKQEQLRIEQEAQEKTTREKADAKEQARQEALRPDKKVLETYLNDLSSNIKMRKVPHMQTTEGKMVLSFIQTQIEKVFVDTLKKLEEM